MGSGCEISKLWPSIGKTHSARMTRKFCIPATETASGSGRVIRTPARPAHRHPRRDREPRRGAAAVERVPAPPYSGNTDHGAILSETADRRPDAIARCGNGRPRRVHNRCALVARTCAALGGGLYFIGTALPSVCRSLSLCGGSRPAGRRGLHLHSDFPRRSKIPCWRFRMKRLVPLVHTRSN